MSGGVGSSVKSRTWGIGGFLDEQDSGDGRKGGKKK